MSASQSSLFKGDLINRTRESCEKTRIASNIKISDSAIDSFLESLNEKDFNRLKSQHGVSFPLKFPSVLVEVNFLSVLAMLNTLSGYRLPLHEATGVGSYQNIVKLLMGLYLSSPDSNDSDSTSLLSSKGLKNLSATTVAEILQVKLHVEKPHETIPGLTVGLREGPINEAVELIVQACNETGKTLEEANHRCLGDFVVEQLKGSQKVKEETKDEEKAANYFLEALVSLIPAFDDRLTFDDGQEVFVFKKAFLLLMTLYQCLVVKASSKDLYVPEPKVLPIFCDNVISSMLHHSGILDLSESTSEKLRGWKRMEGKEGKVGSKIDGPQLSKEDAYRVRAAAVDAGLVIKKRALELAEKEEGMKWLQGVTEADFDGYFWSVAKDDPILRSVPRLVERDTIMY